MINKLIIEIGTNSIKVLYVQWVRPDWQVLAEQVHPTRLGEGLHHSGSFSPAAIERNIRTIRIILHSYPDVLPVNIHIIATQGMRQAANAGEFISLCQEQFGFDIEVLTGRQEAELSFLAVNHSLFEADSIQAVLDIGGGSTELAVGNDNKLFFSKSLPFGAVNLTEQFIRTNPISEQDFLALSTYAQKRLQKFEVTKPLKSLTGVGGTLVTLLLLEYPEYADNPVALDNKVLYSAVLAKRIEQFKTMTVNDIAALPGMPSTRADIILAGALIALTVMRFLKMDFITVSTKGVRYGYLYTLKIPLP